METAAELTDPALKAKFAPKLLAAWVDACNDFLQWQRQEILQKRASPQKLSEHRDTLKLMLRLGRSFHAQVSDPDFPLPDAAREVSRKLVQLEKSWEMIHNPMSDAEADAVLAEAFPDESRTGSAAPEAAAKGGMFCSV